MPSPMFPISDETNHKSYIFTPWHPYTKLTWHVVTLGLSDRCGANPREIQGVPQHRVHSAEDVRIAARGQGRGLRVPAILDSKIIFLLISTQKATYDDQGETATKKGSRDIRLTMTCGRTSLDGREPHERLTILEKCIGTRQQYFGHGPPAYVKDARCGHAAKAFNFAYGEVIS